MLSHYIDFLTPRVSTHTRLLSAAVVWSTIAIFLSLKGLRFSNQSYDIYTLTAIISGACLGIGKSWLIFDRVAKKIIFHIGSKPRRACLGGLFSFRNWTLILIMAVFGKTIGSLPMNNHFKTTIYIMVGCGLGFSSRLLWKAWRNSPRVDFQEH